MSFFLISFIILSAFYSYMGIRLILPAPINIFWKGFVWSVLPVLILLPLLPIILRVKGFEEPWVDLFAWLGYMSLGFFSLVCAFLIVRDMIWITLLILKKMILLGHLLFTYDSQSSLSLPDPERRQLMAHSLNLGILGLTAPLTAYGLFQARRDPEVKEVTIPLRYLPREFEGFRIVQITDLHVGSTIKKDFVRRVVEQVNKLSPDIVALTGDVADGSVSRLTQDVAPLAEIRSKYGKFFVTGNHEYYSGAEDWMEEMKRLGFTPLMNEHRIIKRGKDSILLAGVPDHNAGRFFKAHDPDPDMSLRGVSADLTKILLTHQPRTVPKAAQAGFELQISGHTHGGQYFPWSLLVSLGQPYIAGLHKHDNTWIYVSKGTGYWGPPSRLGVRSEISRIRLIREV